jgi:hypothetical protein
MVVNLLFLTNLVKPSVMLAVGVPALDRRKKHATWTSVFSRTLIGFAVRDYE